LEKIRVIIADDHPAFREGLCRLLADEDELEVVGQAADGEEAVSLTKELKPDVAIIDVTMPRLNGIEAARRIKTESPDTAVLIVSAFNYQNYILASLRAGAAGYLTKDTPIRELVDAVRVAHAGEGIIDRTEAEKVIRHIIEDKDRKKGNLDLFPRELEVLKLTAKGLRNKEIARELSISERTVQSHLSNIFSKLDVDSRTEAVLQALKEGWLDISDLT
jgi:two-component system, NarL family, response regulator LiaR